MLRKKGKYSVTRYAIYSLGFHLFLLALATISISLPKKEDSLLMDVEIAGEGEFREAVANNFSPTSAINPEIEPIAEEPKIEEKPIPEVIEEPSQEQEGEHQIIPEEPQQVSNEIPQEQEIPQEIPEEKIDEPKIEEQEQPTTEATEEKVEEEKTIEEESVPKEEVKEEKQEEAKKEEKKKIKKKKRDKKAMMDVIKRAEKETKKKNRRKKMQELAQKAEKRSKRNAAFDEMLENNSKELKKLARKNSRNNARQNSGRGKKGNGAGSFGTGNGIAESDYEMISSQIYPHWVVPSGVRDAENIIIEIKIEVGDNGEVRPSSIQIVDERRYMKDDVFRAAADSARRAILQASPLSIPREKISLFREITLRFNLREALGE